VNREDRLYVVACIVGTVGLIIIAALESAGVIHRH
jgi:hypothetical protein